MDVMPTIINPPKIHDIKVIPKHTLKCKKKSISKLLSNRFAFSATMIFAAEPHNVKLPPTVLINEISAQANLLS